MLPESRVIYNDNGTLSEISREVSDLAEAGKTFAWVAAQDYLYIGAEMPFNHRHFQLGSAGGDVNAVAGNVSVDIWDGGAWRAAVSVMDLTKNSSGVSFAQSGKILWTPDRSYEWGLEESTEDMGSPLSSLKIYDKYWARLSFSGAFAFKLAYLGYKFSRDNDMRIYYPDLVRNDVWDAYFGDSTTRTWDRLHIAAAEEIVQNLRNRRIVWSRNQILEPDQFAVAGAHKVAEMVYSPGALNQPEHMAEAVKKYNEVMGRLNFKVDKNGDGKIQRYEGVPTSRVRRR